MTKTNSNIYPSTIEAVGDGAYWYRWGIEEVTATDPETEEVNTSYNYYQVKVWNLSQATITEAVIAAVWPSNDEKKLINDYNAAVKEILDDSYIVAYTDFLTQRKALKEQIAADWAAWTNN